ncbi:MAG: RdgB/HAM1 family non-canonical purine NTP pyrophosphatase [Fimbriimonadales bacterium]|nr:RdgB/HAM1 family non-canonical purine NTP pyrophosphatase [Fimbriimonadales bacterium]
MNRIVVATRNLEKGSEMVTILSELLRDWSVLTLESFPQYPEPDEIGSTYAENALIKAVAARDAIGESCIADDAGLEIASLYGAPGVESKRFLGEETPFNRKMERILELMKDVSDDKRSARFRCAVAIAIPHKEVRVFESVREGRIVLAPCGNRGFGYDAIFEIPELGKTYAELEATEKNAISHRGIVLREAARWLRSQ